MLEGPELEKAIRAMLARLGIVNTAYIRKIAAQIRQIGELSQSSINRLVAMSEMYANINEITEELQLATAANNIQLRALFEQAEKQVYTDPRFSAYLAKNPDAVRPEARARISRYVQAVYRQTAGNMLNYSNSTAITPLYTAAIDRAILAASTGVASYTETMRETVRAIGRSGMQVYYASGHHRRLDTAVRQNIVDGINQINKNASIMLGEELGYDAIEISAHAMSAPDHEPVQGHVFLKAQFEAMQNGEDFVDIDGNYFTGFRRAIGEWNCRHTPMSFSTKWSVRKWKPEQLQALINNNQNGCVIDGKHRTLYEASQIMREIETEVRRQKDAAVAAQAAGDEALRQQCQRDINALVKRYGAISRASGVAERRQRMTVEGFRSVSTGNAPSASGNSPLPPSAGLTSGTRKGIMTPERIELQRRILSGDLPTKINEGDQRKHILEPGEATKPNGRSYFTISRQEIEEIARTRLLSGTVRRGRDGVQLREYLDMGKTIGIDGRTGDYTSLLVIVYSKSGIHLFPTIDRRGNNGR